MAREALAAQRAITGVFRRAAASDRSVPQAAGRLQPRGGFVCRRLLAEGPIVLDRREEGDLKKFRVRAREIARPRSILRSKDDEMNEAAGGFPIVSVIAVIVILAIVGTVLWVVRGRAKH
jgi:hypothetical protein